jgi:hypothetical protein
MPSPAPLKSDGSSDVPGRQQPQRAKHYAYGEGRSEIFSDADAKQVDSRLFRLLAIGASASGRASQYCIHLCLHWLALLSVAGHRVSRPKWRQTRGNKCRKSNRCRHRICPGSRRPVSDVRIERIERASDEKALGE